MNEKKESSFGETFDHSYIDSLRNDAQQQMIEADICGNDNPREKIEHYKAASEALRLADTLEERTKEEPKKGFIGWLTKKRQVSIADAVVAIIGPILVLVGTKYTADKKLEEAKINAEVEKIKADSAERIERMRCESRERQLERLCRASDEEVIPDTLSLKVLNDNNR